MVIFVLHHFHSIQTIAAFTHTIDCGAQFHVRKRVRQQKERKEGGKRRALLILRA